MPDYAAIMRSILGQQEQQRLAKAMPTSNPYGIPTNYPLPPEAYGRSGPPPGYTTYTGETGGVPLPEYGGSLPPAASGVRAGPAYPDTRGEPVVQVQPPYDPYRDPSTYNPPPNPDWQQPYNPGSTNIVRNQGGQQVPAPPAQAQVYSGPGYTDPRAANQFIGGLVGWNGPGQANVGAGEPDESGMQAMLQKFGLTGRSAGGRMPGKFK